MYKFVNFFEELDNLRSLEKENVDLKACIISKDKELEIEKRKIEEVTEFEKEKYKKVVHKLQQCKIVYR